ncbi:hypothetical protein [Acidiphilium acidophilum]|nr:hypothetical protein [Acidiphilium acidophilum]
MVEAPFLFLIGPIAMMDEPMPGFRLVEESYAPAKNESASPDSCNDSQKF